MILFKHLRKSKVKGPSVKKSETTEYPNSWEQVLSILGKTETEILPYYSPINKFEISVNAYVKLCTIAKVLNGEWIADFNNRNQKKYYPYFERKKGLWCFYGCTCYYGSSYGLSVFLYFKDEKTAQYMCKTFINEYNEYLQTSS